MNEIKQDISAFRCELMEVLKNSGMDVKHSDGYGQGKAQPETLPMLKILKEFSFQGSGGKKNRQRERRLMKGFNISTAAPPSNSTSLLSEVVEVEQDPDAIHYDKRSPKVNNFLIKNSPSSVSCQ